MTSFRKVLVAKKFMDKGQGKYQDFPSEMFVSQCRKMP